MSVYRRPRSPFYIADFTVDGVRFRRSTKATTERAARAAESRLQKAIEARGAHARPRLTLRQAFARYQLEEADHHAGADDEERQLDGLLAGLGPDTRLHQLGQADIASYIARRRADSVPKGRDGDGRPITAPIANATVNREVELLRRVFNTAASRWGVDAGPAREWGRLLLPEPEERVRELSAREEAALFAHLRPDYHPLVRCALMTGIRVTNLRTLTWKQVDYDAGIIIIKIKSRKPGGRTLTFPIQPALRALLANQKGKHPINVFTYECRRSRGRRRKGQRYPFSQHGWRKDWRAALTAAGIEDFRFHDTRHTFATRIVRATGNLKAAQKLLGHSTITTTARYAHATMDDLRAALDAAERHTGGTLAEAGNAKRLKKQAKS